jgi:DNA end-binding protein Ku
VHWSVEIEPEVRQWLELLSDPEYDKVERAADMLAAQPTTLGEPYARHLGGKLRELRFAMNGNAVRVTYWLAPDPAGAKAYRLLAQAMADRGAVAICKITLRDKEHLATLRLHDGVFVLETMHWPDEIRASQFEELDKQVKVRPQEVQMARSLIENLTEAWEPERYTDEYREALVEMVEKKVAGEEVEVIPEPEKAPEVVDLMDALKQSVEATKKERKPAKKTASRKRAAS